MVENSESDSNLLSSEGEAESFVEVIADTCEGFLRKEARIEKFKWSFFLNNINKLELKDITSMISVDDKNGIIIAFSYDEGFLKKVMENYVSGIDITEKNYQFYLEETAGDMINIVLGLSIGKYAKSRRIFNFTPPIIINKGKNISSYKGTKFFGGDLSSEFGNMSLFVIVAGELACKHITDVNID